MSTAKTPENIENVVHEKKEELRMLENALNKMNEDIVEYMQLEKSIQFFKQHKPDGFKTQVDCGSNSFIQAEVNKIEPIIVNIGLNVYLELKLEEALKFLEMKIKILNKETDVVRSQSLKIRAEIKILLMYLAEARNIVPPSNNK
jgi:prefoldin alpha subunit